MCVNVFCIVFADCKGEKIFMEDWLCPHM